MIRNPDSEELAMSKVIMIGCDLHDATLVLHVAVGQQAAVKKRFLSSEVEEMIGWLKELARRNDAPRIVFAYEASGQGFGLYDQLTDAGIECYVLAPTHLPHTNHRRKCGPTCSPAGSCRPSGFPIPRPATTARRCGCGCNLAANGRGSRIRFAT